MCSEARLAPRLYESLAELHSPEVIEDIGGVIAFSLLHQVLLDLYSSEIVIEQEPILFRTIDCGEELVRRCTRVDKEEVPIYSLCCLCKDIRVRSGWIPIERVVGEIESDAVFSHGFCERCAERQMVS